MHGLFGSYYIVQLQFMFKILSQHDFISITIVGLSAYIRFKQVETFIATQTKAQRASGSLSSKLPTYNKIGIVFGAISALGASVVGIFNEKDSIIMHIVGAWMAFGGGSLYFIFQVGFHKYFLTLFNIHIL